ncbi:hypothetical protein L7F22_064775 [Adiantum nelumboides]|nr:hypothetical protein [Adiantum nelumboides]
MYPAKLEVIKYWPNPRNLHELRSFTYICPLHDLTKQNVKYVWTQKKQQAFDALKQKLTSHVLALPDLSKPFEVQCDACGDCLASVLLQEGHAIALESCRLNLDEKILGIYEKELLAVLHALESWKHYLLGNPFILRTDHQSLKYFMTQTKLFHKQMRWANFLSRFNFHIAHIASKHNQVDDALSRRPKVNAVSIATHNDLSSMIDEYATDSDFKDVVSAIALGKKEEPFTLQDGYLLHGNRLCITRSLREKIWKIVDRFSKQAHFIPVKKTIGAYQMATLFISQIFKYHGLPMSIVSDRDPRMTINFRKDLFENLGTRLNFSSAYHPHTDGQSEIANLTILDLLKAYVTEVDQFSQWEKYLPLVEYAYNNIAHTSTGKAPFEVIEEKPKSPLLLKVHGEIFATDEYS